MDPISNAASPLASNHKVTTEQKETQQALEQNQQKLEALFEALPVGISILDNQRRIIKHNTALGKILGISHEDLQLGKFLKRSYLRGDGTPMPVNELPSVRVISENSPVSDVEVGVVKEDGATIWTNVSATPFPFDDWHVIIVTSDLTHHKQLEEQLAITASIVETTDDAIYTKDLDGIIASWNSGSEKLYGYTATEIIGRSVALLFPPGRKDELNQIIDSIRQGKKMDRLVTRRLRKDGEEIDVDVTVAPVKDLTGKIRGASSIAHDVTAQVKTQELLRASHDQLEKNVQERTTELVMVVQALQEEIVERKKAESELRVRNTALEAAANGIIITDVQGRILWSNQSFTEMTGYGAEELLGRDTGLLNSGQQPTGFYRQLWDTILSGQVWRGEIINRRKNGSQYNEEQTITPVFDDHGALSCFIAIKQDITERKKAEALVLDDAAHSNILADVSRVLGEIGAHYAPALDQVAHLIADSVGDACIISLLAENDHTIYSSTFASAGKAVPEEMLKLIMESKQPEHWASNIVLQTGQPLMVPELSPQEVENLISPENLKRFHGVRIHSLLIVPLRALGHVIGRMLLVRVQDLKPYTSADQAYIQNLADRVALAIANARLYIELENSLENEQKMRSQMVQAEKFSAMGRMLASITHEFNNPLQTIKNCLYLTRQEIPEGTTYPYLEMISGEVQRLSNLVAQLREVYRPRAVGLRQEISLLDILDQVHSLVAHHLLNSHVEWQQAPVEGTYPISCVVDQLKQVFINISLNAIEAMQPDGGLIVVNLLTDPALNQIGVSFQDTGPGIPEENIPRIFEPLFTTKQSGLGLGLSICFDIIQAHNGRIAVSSQAGIGTNFTLWLPMAVEIL